MYVYHKPDQEHDGRKVMVKNIKYLLKIILGSSFISKIRRYIFLTGEFLFGHPHLKKKFYSKLGYELDLNNPKSLNQKICWKKVNDRNPLIPLTSDKYRVRKYIKMILGEEEANKLLVPLLFVTDKPETIPFDELPDEYIIKANYGSGKNIIINNSCQLNKIEIISQCKHWLKEPYPIKRHTWTYQNVKRKIIIEKLLRDENGNIPADYKFNIFHGKCEFIYVITDRYEDKKISYYDSNWNYLNITSKENKGNILPPPKCLDRMIEVAEILGSDFDYVRVDLYEVNNAIYFGEFTHYPSGGYALFNPQSFDFEMGTKLRLKKSYWKNKNMKLYGLEITPSLISNYKDG